MADPVWNIALLITGLLMILLIWWGQKSTSLIATVCARWMRWIFASLAIAHFSQALVFPAYPEWILVTSGALLWFLLETSYNYLVVNALSRSGLPLFPRFQESDSQESWPAGKPFIRLRDAIRQRGFSRAQTLVSKIGGQTLIRLVVFRDEAGTTQLSVFILTTSPARLGVALSLHSETVSGRRLITDNVSLPFGGFYPPDWALERHPFRRNLENLYNRHRSRIDAQGEELVPLEASPLERLNEDQSRLEKLNRELGFLNDHAAEEEQGKISPEGRYRVWKEIWTLGYLGRPRHY